MTVITRWLDTLAMEGWLDWVLLGVAFCVFCGFATEVLRVARGRSQRVWPMFVLLGCLLLIVGLFVLIVASRSPLESESPQEEQIESGEVIAVIDGDTFDVQLPEGKVRVRIIGIDTPELAHQAGEVDDCYAQDARTFLDDLVYGRTVTLQADPTQADTDKYGRLLRHVYRGGVNVALWELRNGAGVEYTYDTPYTGQRGYVAAMVLARETGEGLWGECGQ